ncbi:3-hydroxybutyrate dehydrogenase (plasmid) [Azospirillum oryzae]|uniref:3-hydroxybutyrate dehydrogenase n=1 Tax=Azospirillum oryzae TaxID=286727 RepID=A0A6N1AG21_9PROT|nr:3-hydroxybutyrate dehydrogenase [Azospirillum oryzae]KAA0587330.1 3-hydroxybutyrate dehydrogenase [Azospirillum oryzae]QKS50611.1 3-hydroxybutyrate dehydrogenase [Azospirillum oryzae]GLR79187.1 3-hydroxybutyrate dehydrogenase [Azospirillum oryzae]
MQNRNAVVTGSTSGIGLATVRELAGRGCHVVVNGFGDRAEIDRTCAEIAELSGTRIVYSGADLSRPEEARALMAEAADLLGPIDILVNNAGIQHVAALHEFPDDKWDLLLAVNLSAAFHTIKAAVPAMRERGWGRIVNTASVLGMVGAPHKPAYVAAKHGIIGLTKSVSIEVAGHGITCNAVCPGTVLTPIIERQIAQQAQVTGLPEDQVLKAVFLEKMPTGRLIGPEEVAAAIAFLCSDAAASITGAILPVDGGYTTH